MRPVRMPSASTLATAAIGGIALWAVASGLLAFFPDDPVGTVTRGAAKIHLVLAAVAFFAVAVGARLTTRALRVDPRWQPAFPALVFLSYGAFVPILLLGRAHLRPHSLGGLYEKVFLGVELAWFLVAALWVVATEADPERRYTVSRSGL